MKVAEIKRAIEQGWGQTPVGDVCLVLVDSILGLQPKAAAALTYQNILDLVGDDSVTPELVAALNLLTNAEFAILDAGGFFIDEDDNSHELTAEQFQNVLSRNFLVHPDLGYPVEDAANKVCPFFSLKNMEANS